MSLDVTAIRDQPLSGHFTNYFRCDACGVVDRDQERVKAGHHCAKCGSSGRGAATLHFGIQVYALLDLMQDAFHGCPPSEERPWTYSWSDAEADHKLAVVIYFTTLGEVLLDQLLRSRMEALAFEIGVRKNLLGGHQTMAARVSKLFPALAGTSWRTAVKAASAGRARELEDAELFYLKARKARNLFLHEANKWAIPAAMPAQCLRSIEPLLSLFAELHNRHCRVAA